MAAIPRVDVFPMTCPACAAAAGFPYRATTIPDSSAIDLGVRCHVCRHEWDAFMEAVQPGQTKRARVLRHQRAS